MFDAAVQEADVYMQRQEEEVEQQRGRKVTQSVKVCSLEKNYKLIRTLSIIGFWLLYVIW